MAHHFHRRVDVRRRPGRPVEEGRSRIVGEFLGCLRHNAVKDFIAFAACGVESLGIAVVAPRGRSPGFPSPVMLLHLGQ
jgi:hypothetical protein